MKDRRRLNGRREFVKTTGSGLAALLVPIPGMTMEKSGTVTATDGPKISLAQWSLHRALQEGALKAADFPKVARESYGITAVEYVNQFYRDRASEKRFWQEMRRNTDNLGVNNLLIMVDDEGELGHPTRAQRDQAVSRHMKWVEAARVLGCHSIRVNAFGPGDRDSLREALADGLHRLAQRASEAGIAVLVENHGFHTSDGEFMAAVMREADHPGLGTLPDFGNWCLTREWGSTQDGDCEANYGPERGLRDFLPLAGGVSAKSYDFDAAGNETRLPYPALLQLVKDSGFSGHIGIEYEGNRLSEPEGIRATKNLIERLWPTLD